MAEAALATLVEAGEQLFAVKLFITSVQCLWIYDYLLTLGDEIKYAWSGRRSWVFALFIANRYAPVLNLVWSSVLTHSYTKPLCQATKWMAILHPTIVTVLAQITVTLRIYAVTEKNKWLVGALSVLIASQFCCGVFSTVWIGIRPLQALPNINLDVFKLCIYDQWRLGQYLFVNIAVAFDVLAFSIIFFTARKFGSTRFPGIRSLFDILLRDATRYFVLMFLCQFLSQLFLFIHQQPLQLFPGLAGTVLVPIMASRMMLSLKKAAVDPNGMWSLSTMSDHDQAGDGTVHFASRVPSGLGQTSGSSMLPNEEGVELGPVT